VGEIFGRGHFYKTAKKCSTSHFFLVYSNPHEFQGKNRCQTYVCGKSKPVPTLRDTSGRQGMLGATTAAPSTCADNLRFGLDFNNNNNNNNI
jgi:hypothetical protein